MLHILWILISLYWSYWESCWDLRFWQCFFCCSARYATRRGLWRRPAASRRQNWKPEITWLFHVIGVRFCFHNGEGKLVILFFGVSLETIKGWLKKLKGGRRKNSVSQTSRSKAKKRKKKSAQTKGISQENRTKKPRCKRSFWWRVECE